MRSSEKEPLSAHLCGGDLVCSGNEEQFLVGPELFN
jgi:hypothetical protein